MKIVEQSLAPKLSIVDVVDDLIWHRDGSVTLLYQVGAFHEPGMTEDAFNQAAWDAENAFNGLPEGTSYQWYVLVDHRRAVRSLEQHWPPIAVRDERSRLLEEFRSSRLAELARVDETTGAGALIQERRHYLAATFRPKALAESWRDRARAHFAWLRGAARRRRWVGAKYERAHEAILAEAGVFDRAVTVRLLRMGLGFRRCPTADTVGFLYELLNPTTSPLVDVQALSERARFDRSGLPRSVLEDLEYAGDLPPLASILYDDVWIRREHLQVGDYHVGVVSLKTLPDKTEPGMVVPLMHLSRPTYRLCYRVDIPAAGAELAALRAKATLADGLQLKDMLVKSERKDAHAEAVGRQTGKAMEQIIASTQRITGTSLQLVLYESSADALKEAVAQAIGAMSSCHGLGGYRETWLLRDAYLSTLPGAPMLVERRRRTLTPNAVDFLPVFDLRASVGKIPFTTPTNGVLWYDPFDTRTGQPNANILVTGTSGWGKSVAVNSILSGYEVACAARGEPSPYVFVLDVGASYQRFMQLRPDGRYVLFDYHTPPGVDIWRWFEDEELEEHVGRLSELLMDLLRIDTEKEERFDRVKAVLEQTLFQLYRRDGERSFVALSELLRADGRQEAIDLESLLYPFIDGKFSRLVRPNPELEMSEDVHAICFDFGGVEQDLMSLALRFVIYEIRRWAARVGRRRHRTFLVLDESWSMLAAQPGRRRIVDAAAPFLAASIRMGRKHGMSVIALSQASADFAESAYGSALIANTSTKLIGAPGDGGLKALEKHYEIGGRRLQQVQQLVRGSRFREFLLVQDGVGQVVRIALDPFSRWVFTTDADDRTQLAQVAARHPDMPLFDQMQLLARGPA